jgi:outer membrane biosynthesis protein TonB
MTEKTDDESVLGSLPATRPTRFGGERRKSANGKSATATKAKPKAAPKPRAVAKPKPKPAPAARPAHGPRPVRAGAPSLAESTERARTAEPAPESTTSPPSGTELVTTAIQAAGELAQIGLAVGGQVLKRAVDKLPKP